MESILLWGVDDKKGMLHAASRCFDSPLRLALQKGEQFVWRSELAFAEARGHNCFNGLQFFSRISANVDLRCGQITVPQPERDFSNVLRGLQHDHGAGMSEYMGRYLFALQR